jgi:hypothetical protein
MVGHHLGAVVVALTREAPRQRHIIFEPGAGLHQRNDGGRDAALIHLIERHLRRPFRRAAAAALGLHDVGMERRHIVVVNVDPDSRCERRRLRQCRAGADS